MDTIEQKVLDLPQTFITLDELDKLIGLKDYAHFVVAVKDLVANNTIKPVGKKQDTNGKIPALRLKYRIIRLSEDDRPYIEEVKMLHPSLDISGYIENIGLYKKHRSVLKPLSEFLMKNGSSLDEPMSKNERSYSIWNDEKLLDQPLTQTVIRFNRFEERLNFYLTPEPFFDYVRRQTNDMNILILENKDTWFTLRRLFSLRPDSCVLFGLRVDALLYGEGNKICRPFALTEYGISSFGNTAHYYYFGDLDYTGIELFLRVQKANPELNITLFRQLYEEMLQCRPDTLGEIKHQQSEPEDISAFLGYFNPDVQECICCILGRNRYIPQEIIHYQRLKKLLTCDDEDIRMVQRQSSARHNEGNCL